MTKPFAAANKTSNAYADSISYELFSAIPKSVFAAIAISALTCGGDQLDEATTKLIEEWNILHQNGIVPQAPPRKFIASLPDSE